MAGTCLFGASRWKFITALLHYEIVHVSFFFFFLIGGTEIVNAQGSAKDWYLPSLNKYTDTKSCYL